MLATFSYVTFWIAVVVQIVNGWILVTVGDQFIYLKGLRKLDVSESLLQEIKHTSLVAQEQSLLPLSYLSTLCGILMTLLHTL